MFSHHSVSKYFGNTYVCLLSDQLINYAYKHNMLGITQRHGIITCLPNGDKQKYLLKIGDQSYFQILFIVVHVVKLLIDNSS